MNENITITRKYERYYHNAKNMKKWKNIKNKKLWVGEWRLGKTPRYPNPNTTENRMISTLTPFLYFRVVC